jgi:Ulp1 family protease
MSALSQRIATQLDDRMDRLTPTTVLDPDAIATIIANDKNALQVELKNGNSQPRNFDDNNNNNNNNKKVSEDYSSPSFKTFVEEEATASRVSEMIARAGSGNAFDGQSLGIGGLDDVLIEIKRRIWTPLAAPPQLLKGI